MRHRLLLEISAFLVVLPWSGVAAVATTPSSKDIDTAAVAWLGDYADATQDAKESQQPLLIFFDGGQGDARSRQFAQATLTDPAVCKALEAYTCVRLPADTAVGQGRLLDHASFREMLGRPGIAIVDYRDPESWLYGRIVSTFPLTAAYRYPPAHMLVILGLPTGTLTERTMIYAVRIHSDRPQSTAGTLHDHLRGAATRHSAHQARICRQGHHQWESRFHRINRHLPGGQLATEVCAESWSGEDLVEAAIECVRCWRLSSGHWSAVRKHHANYGYDIRRGHNGIWYATGIFGG